MEMGVELISEIMLSCHYGDVIHKKQILDQAKDCPRRLLQRLMRQQKPRSIERFECFRIYAKRGLFS